MVLALAFGTSWMFEELRTFVFEFVQEHGPRVEAGDQMAIAIQQMTNILARLVDQQDQMPVNQPQNPEIGEDRVLRGFKNLYLRNLLKGLIRTQLNSG